MLRDMDRLSKIVATNLGISGSFIHLQHFPIEIKSSLLAEFSFAMTSQTHRTSRSNSFECCTASHILPR